MLFQGPVPVGMGGNYSPLGSQRRKALKKEYVQIIINIATVSISNQFIIITIIIVITIIIIIVTEKFEDETHVTPVVKPAGHLCAEAE